MHKPATTERHCRMSRQGASAFMLLLDPRRIPQRGADGTEDVPDGRRDEDESGRPSNAERTDPERRFDEMQPEDEVEDGLGPADEDESRPRQMPDTQDTAEDET
jgi:hypothetical protein